MICAFCAKKGGWVGHFFGVEKHYVFATSTRVPREKRDAFLIFRRRLA